MSTPNPLQYGYGFRQTPQGQQPQAPQQGGQLPPSIESLKQAMMAQQQGDRAQRIRSSIRMPTETKNLGSAFYDIWRSNRAEDKQQEAVIKAAEAQEQKAQEAQAQEAEQRKAQAAAVYQFLLTKGMPQDQAIAAADAVYQGALSASDVLPKESAAGDVKEVKEVGEDGVERSYFVDPRTGQPMPGSPRITGRPTPDKPDTLTQRQRFAIADNLSDDFKPVKQEYLQGLENIETMRALVNEVSDGASDVATLYSFIKNLDPESVVREGEVALSQQAISAVARLQTAAEKVYAGRLLTDDFKRDILKSSEVLYRELSKSAGRAWQDAKSRAEAAEFDPNEVYGKYTVDMFEGLGKEKPKSATPEPPAGFVVDP